MKFLVTMEEGEDGYIVVSCPALQGCISQGKTKEEALANIAEAIEGFIFVTKDRGEPLPAQTDFHEVKVAV